LINTFFDYAAVAGRCGFNRHALRVGMGRTPQRWLKPGDVVTVSIEGLGALTIGVAE